MSRKLIQNNIDNLTTLWTLASDMYTGLKVNSTYNIAEVKDSEWPNRIWNKNIFQEDDLSNLHNLLDEYKSQLIYIKWYEETDKIIDESQNLGLNLLFNQIGMSLAFDDYIICKVSAFTKLIAIHSDDSVNQWSTIFLQCFGYKIPFHVIKVLRYKVKYYLIYWGNTVIGCVSTYEKDNEIGIHSLGILKEFRKNGYAEEAMHLLLSDAKRAGLDYAHLQSSLLGLSIYTKIGFKAVFQIGNYKLIY
ncbi:GNAT family N-acetyltransferase [Sphingobacterium sp. SG20118]|uniref:GNAT family N-acetyltransferase n=1 Tax=Sphingobacterium sp. SG20118 TaxID=3367156 RepID=UPI0037DFC7F9